MQQAVLVGLANKTCDVIEKYDAQKKKTLEEEKINKGMQSVAMCTMLLCNPQIDKIRHTELKAEIMEIRRKDGYKNIQNLYVIVIGIEKYKDRKNLKGVRMDVKRMIDLFGEHYEYKNITCINAGDKWEFTRDEVIDFIKSKCGNLNSQYSVVADFIDGIAFCFSGYGDGQKIWCSDGQSINIRQEIFKELGNSGLAMKHRGKPRIYIMDCKVSQDVQSESDAYSFKPAASTVHNQWVNEVSNEFVVWSDYKHISTDETDGSCLTRAFCKVMTEYKYDNIPLIKLAFCINKAVFEESEGKQASTCNYRLLNDVVVTPDLF